MEAKDILGSLYMPFAISTIKERSVPHIDGLKPVQRKVVYAMYELGLLRDTNATKKAARIIGDTMGKYHPHGDGSIYQAACAMADTYEGANASFIKGRGNLGKKWSNPKLGGIHAGAMRYTEFGFTPLAKELFDGIKENAVNFVPNFDESEKEPELLPVSFPNILVNMNKGIAVGLGSCIPSYELKNVCNAVAGILDGSLVTDEDVVKVLGVPDFQCECRVHYDDALLMKLYKTHGASFKCTGTFHISGNEIIIDSVPPTTTFEAVTTQIREYALTPDGKDIEDVISNTGKGTKGIRIKVKRNTNVQNLIKVLYSKTKLMDTMSFYTQIIWKDKPAELSVKEVIKHWLAFRDTTLSRIYNFRLKSKKEQEHEASTWDKIKDDLKGVVAILSNNTEEKATELLMTTYGLDKLQCDYLLGMQVRNICTDKAQKALEKLAKLQAEVQELDVLTKDRNARKTVIINDLRRIANTYGTARKSSLDGLIQMDLMPKKRVIPDTMSTIFFTKKGFIKALDGAQGMNDADRFLSDGDEILIGPLYARKNEHLLIYTYSGMCYKLLVDVIESSRGSFKQFLWEVVQRRDDSDVFYITKSGNYTEKFAIIYGSGRGRLVDTAKVSGKMTSYKNQFQPGTPEIGYQNTLMLLPYDRFVLVTARQKAAMGTLEFMRQYSVPGHEAFKVTRITEDDALIKVLDAKNFEAYVQKGYIDTKKYQKGYPVAYKNDPITYLDKPVEEFEKAWAEFQARQEEKRRAAEAEAAAKAEAKAAKN